MSPRRLPIETTLPARKGSSGRTIIVRLGLLLAVALVAGVLIGVGAGSAARASGSATAIAVSLTLPGSPPIEGGAASSAATAQASGGFRYPEDGSLISVPTFASSASGGEGSSVSQAVVDIPEASLFGGEIVLGGIATRARVRSEGSTVAADSQGSTLAAVAVFGQAVVLTDGQPTPIGDWGSLVVGATEVEGAAAHKQILVKSVRLTLLAEHRGLPAGTEISFGTATAELEVDEPVSSSPATTNVAPTTVPKRKPPRQAEAKPSAPPKPRRKQGPVLPLPADIDVTPELTKNGYVFPIFGQAWYSSTLGAPRANTGWHHGTDIFAAFGAPVLAIADGTLFSVGWNKVGGYRLWLRDRQGNQFYYAHLAAYSPLAVEGREVRAGQVIGFNGNSGDAQGTPFHVHFEVHPVGLLPLGYDGVVDPYPYLLAWRRLEDVALSVGTGWAPSVTPTATAPKPAAVLLQASDISTASGLEPGALDRAAAGRSPSGADMFFNPSKPCAECEGSAP